MIDAKIDGTEVEVSYKGTEEEIVNEILTLADELMIVLATDASQNALEREWKYGQYCRALTDHLENCVIEGL